MTVPRREVAEQLSRVLGSLAPLPSVPVSTWDAVGRVLAADVRAAADVPGFDQSAMDGYALRGLGAGSFAVVADLPAGSPLDPALRPGEAARIMTGAPVPSDAEAVVPQEDTDRGNPVVTVAAAPPAGAHLRRRGEDLRAGDVVAAAGALVTSWRAAAIAAAGVAAVTVRAAPRVGVIATGSELVSPGVELERGDVPESNGGMLAALAASAGAVVARVARVADDPAALRGMIAELDVDVIVISGGVSVGAHDVTRTVLGDAIEFVEVAMQPGRPQAFGVLPDGRAVFGLPGNPVAAAVSFQVFVRPALRALQGDPTPIAPTVAAVAEEGWRAPGGREQYLPVALAVGPAGEYRVRPAAARTHSASGLAAAAAIAVVPVGVTEVSAGDAVRILLL